VASLEKHRRDWEDLARLDPMWAVVSDNDRRFGRWDNDEFFATGEREVAAILARAADLGVPTGHGDALEFGCGVGRVTRALATRFDRVVGVDISTEMLAQARELNASVPNAEFVHNTASDLTFVGERRFDLVYSRHVLQHLPDRDIARGYLQEMMRLVRPGGLLLAHIPVRIPARHRLLVVRRAYEALRRVGVPADVLYRRLHLHPVTMLAVPEPQLDRWIREAGGRVLTMDTKRGAVVSANIFATRD
jgi:SAM-dependent methyltransferase